MKIAIMQPYFFPYIGYFQLISAVEEFIIYDNIQYTKKGWINRNRILINNKDEYITLPIKKDSDYLNVNQRFLSNNWAQDRIKLLNKINESYRKAQYFEKVYPIIEKCINFEDPNLFNFIYNSLQEILLYLKISTKITRSSLIDINHNLKSEEKVLEICKKKNASIYINPIGGIELYSKTYFESNGIKLDFQKSNEIKYNQFKNIFVPSLSIIDVIMFNSIEEIKIHLNNFILV
jgi:hypothetical protein